MNYPLIDKNNQVEAVILGDGDFPVHPVATALLHNSAYLCCCDGAGRRCIEHGLMPNAIVGDGDSLSPDFIRRYCNIIHLIREQDDNDLTKATRHCLARAIQRIVYLGTTGKREDHTLGNIVLMIRYMCEFGLQPTLVTDYGWFVPASGMNIFDSFLQQQVSIFNFGCTDFRSEGLRWPSFPYQSLWQGTLNESIGDSFTLYGDGSYLVFRTFEGKQNNPKDFLIE